LICHTKHGFFQKERAVFVIFLQKNRFAISFGIIRPQIGKIEAKAKIGGCAIGNRRTGVIE
jgi:hypothetical protein